MGSGITDALLLACKFVRLTSTLCALSNSMARTSFTTAMCFEQLNVLRGLLTTKISLVTTGAMHCGYGYRYYRYLAGNSNMCILNAVSQCNRLPPRGVWNETVPNAHKPEHNNTGILTSIIMTQMWSETCSLNGSAKGTV